MNKSTSVLGAVSILMLLAAVQASACGDSLFRAGFGLNIPVVKVERAANIVIFTPTGHDVFFDDAKIAARLDKSGHNVTVVHNASAVASANPPAFDVVLARDGDFDVARQTMGDRVTNSVFVPVHEGFAKAGDVTSLSANSQIRQILFVVKQALDGAQAEHPTA